MIKLLKKMLRKAYHLLSFLSIFIFMLTPVKAETYILDSDFNISQINAIISNKIEQYNNAISQYKNEYNHYFATYSKGELYISFFNGGYTITTSSVSPNMPVIEGRIPGEYLLCTINSSDYTCQEFNSNGFIDILVYHAGGTQKYGYNYFDSDFTVESDLSFELQNFYNDSISINFNDNLPKLINLMQYNSWSDYVNNYLENYTEVDLDNYEYVLLSLKDYSQTQAFQTNLQVKGQIGITPIYNYGQTSKDSISGGQVQDRCNINYQNFTDYPFYILQSDLQNNAIYAVKECSSGSSFKFDNTIFNITYITNENKDNPTITIGNNTYNVIPYGDLPSTATNNESNNYIPGQSENVITGDTVGLSGILNNIQRKLSEIWNVFTYFMSFVNQIFSVLPEEIRTVLVASFTIGCVLGLIKILKS